MTIQTLMERRNEWITKTGRFLFETKKEDLPRMAGAFPMYYEVLADYDRKLANAYRDETEENVKLVEKKIDLNNYY